MTATALSIYFLMLGEYLEFGIYIQSAIFLFAFFWFINCIAVEKPLCKTLE